MLEAEADLSRADLMLIDRVASVVHEATSVPLDDLMVVGAQARDVWATALGHLGPLRRTNDLDLGIAVSGMETFRDATSSLTRSGDTGIRFELAGVSVDLLPFGHGVEDPSGLVEPPRRQGQAFSVFGFRDVFRASQTLLLPSGRRTRIVSPAGLTLLKVAAWHDRSSWFEGKDASDLAVIMQWYVDSELVQQGLWGEDPPATLERFDFDVVLAASARCGRLAREVLNPSVQVALDRLWVASRDGLATAVRGSGRWGDDGSRIAARVRAFGDGLLGLI